MDKDWGKEWFLDQDGVERMLFENSLETFRLDQRGSLLYTCRLHTQYEILVLTAWTKRIYSEEPTRWGLFKVFVNILKYVRNAIFTTGLFE